MFRDIPAEVIRPFEMAAILIWIGARLCPQDQSQGLRRVNALRLVLRTQPRSIMKTAVEIVTRDVDFRNT